LADLTGKHPKPQGLTLSGLAASGLPWNRPLFGPDRP